MVGVNSFDWCRWWECVDFCVAIRVANSSPLSVGVLYIFISLIADDVPHSILPVVTKDLPISPRFTPYDFYRDASSALLQLVSQWLNFT